MQYLLAEQAHTLGSEVRLADTAGSPLSGRNSLPQCPDTHAAVAGVRRARGPRHRGCPEGLSGVRAGGH